MTFAAQDNVRQCQEAVAKQIPQSHLLDTLAASGIVKDLVSANGPLIHAILCKAKVLFPDQELCTY
jgi:hypothetical protein